MSWVNESVKKVFELEQRLKGVEERFSEFDYNSLQALQSTLKKNWVTDSQPETYFGLRIGLCVDTKDPWGQGRVRFYMPGLRQKNTPVKALPWAWPISVFGGFDDSGSFWVPPAGSAIVILFENGNKESAFYLGTTWNRDRGERPHNWGYGIPEYDCIHAGHRGGYFVGPNDESQVLPPGNTYNYNIKDYDDLRAFETDTEALKKVTPSHLHILKTAQKHRLKFDDGNYSCNNRWKHVELASSGGNSFLMWDDHMHAAGQHVHPKAANCGPTATGGAGAGLDCGDGSSCPQEESTFNETNTEKFKNDLFKHESEVRAFRGPCTPQNNKCDLQQTGIFLSSVSGQVFVMDDEVSDPQGIPNWERGVEPFDFGSEDKFIGKVFIKSATGHMILMGDAEDASGIRSGEFTHPKTQKYEPNGITLKTATGHSIEMNDHTLEGNTAGQNRRIKIESTSRHLLEMSDYTNEQSSPERSEGGVPVNKAKQAYVRLRSGYGLQLLMRDDNSQEESDGQFIELLSPHKDNCFGPHIFRMQEAPPESPGIVFLRCGGYFYGKSLKDWIEVVGDPEEGCGTAASKVTQITEHDIHVTEKAYVYLSDLEYHQANQFIILAAGRDCEPVDPDEDLQPCIYPVVVTRPRYDIHKGGFFVCPFTRYIHVGIEQGSDRVFGSASNPGGNGDTQDNETATV